MRKNTSHLSRWSCCENKLFSIFLLSSFIVHSIAKNVGSNTFFVTPPQVVEKLSRIRRYTLYINRYKTNNKCQDNYGKGYWIATTFLTSCPIFFLPILDYIFLNMSIIIWYIMLLRFTRVSDTCQCSYNVTPHAFIVHIYVFYYLLLLLLLRVPFPLLLHESIINLFFYPVYC